MKCPICGTWTLIKETRMRNDNTKRRRYECANLHKFNTLEQFVEQLPEVVTHVRPKTFDK